MNPSSFTYKHVHTNMYGSIMTTILFNLAFQQLLLAGVMASRSSHHTRQTEHACKHTFLK